MAEFSTVTIHDIDTILFNMQSIFKFPQLLKNIFYNWAFKNNLGSMQGFYIIFLFVLSI